MDVVVYALCKKLVKDAIASIGDVFHIKGELLSYSDLPLEGNEVGDLYLIGPNLDGSFDEYYWTDYETWEAIGSTAPSMDGYINETAMFRGIMDTGTLQNPAEGTILDTVYKMMAGTYVEQEEGKSLISNELIEKINDLPDPEDTLTKQEADDTYVAKTEYEIEYI